MIYNKIIGELKQHIDKNYKDGSEKFFKHEVLILGVRTNIVRQIANKHINDIKQMDKKEVFDLAERFFRLGHNEYATIGIAFLVAIKDKLDKTDFIHLENILKLYVDNWAKCDDFCTHVINPFLCANPEYMTQVKGWAKSNNRWFRRASAVSFIRWSKDNNIINNINDIFDITLKLINDKDDLVQKGYGWALKEASRNNQKYVFDFVMKHKSEMPRTALRYAIEKMPKELREKAMAK